MTERQWVVSFLSAALLHCFTRRRSFALLQGFHLLLEQMPFVIASIDMLFVPSFNLSEVLIDLHTQ